MKTRREVEGVSLSFLDCICCGFGAIILLLVLSKTAEPYLIEESSADLQGRIAELQQQVAELRGTTTVLNRKLTSQREQLSQSRERLARLRGDLSSVRGEFKASKDNAAVANTIEGKLAEAQQSLTAEMKRLLGAGYRRRASDNTVGGIPVDSEYIVFVIDTSGSMFNFAWNLVLDKISQTLDVYPKVKGLQVMNDMGKYMFPEYRGKWIPDTPGRRKAIVERLATWNPFSNSSPVEGIERAIRAFAAPDKKIGIYVFGDEFTGPSIDSVVTTVDRINETDAQGERRARIHAVGFPVQFARPPHLQITGVRFATLMRILCFRNGGTFVGLRKFTP